ncbi:MAG: hypothetical protein LWW85_10535 [Marinilabiliales bacterium]|nr:hypothetical protein [Marinilabiliales bacterium]
MKSILYFSVALLLLAGCNQATVKKTDNKPSQSATMAPGTHTVVAKDFLQTSGYTYLLLTENGKEYWAAVSRFEPEKGKTYYYRDGMEMTNFKSKELNRVFDSIQFIQDLSDQPVKEKPQVKLTTKGRQNMARVEGLKVEPAAGAIKIGDLFAKKAELSGKKVKVTGQVIKFSAEIMNKNWVHLQDGSGDDNTFDLVVTTKETVAVGTVVTFEGTLTLDKDFGYGYKYDLLVEEALLAK